MTETVTRTATWVKIVLAISLALNLAVVGLWSGAAFRKHPERPQNVESISFLARAMPFKYQAQLRGAIRDRRDDMRSNREEMRAIRDNLVSALQADPFEISAVESVFSEQRTLLSNIVFAGHDEVVAQIASMDAQDRAQYVENLLKPPRAPRRDGQ